MDNIPATQDTRKIGVPNASTTNVDINPIRGTNYFFGIAIDKYVKFKQLNNCVKDITDVSEVLMSNFDFDATNTILIKNEEATQKNILRTLDSFYNKVGENDSFIFFYSGHGENLEGRNIGCLVPVDAQDEYDYLDLSIIKTRLDSFKAKHIHQFIALSVKEQLHIKRCRTRLVNRYQRLLNGF